MQTVRLLHWTFFFFSGAEKRRDPENEVERGWPWDRGARCAVRSTGQRTSCAVCNFPLRRLFTKLKCVHETSKTLGISPHCVDSDVADVLKGKQACFGTKKLNNSRCCGVVCVKTPRRWWTFTKVALGDPEGLGSVDLLSLPRKNLPDKEHRCLGLLPAFWGNRQAKELRQHHLLRGRAIQDGTY